MSRQWLVMEPTHYRDPDRDMASHSAFCTPTAASSVALGTTMLAADPMPLPSIVRREISSA